MINLAKSKKVWIPNDRRRYPVVIVDRLRASVAERLIKSEHVSLLDNRFETPRERDIVNIVGRGIYDRYFVLVEISKRERRVFKEIYDKETI